MESRSADAAGRLIASARALTLRAGGTSFTVAQVVNLSGTSLKTFYRCFSGKDELLVALFAGDARMGASALGELVNRHSEPIERLRSAVVGLFGFIARDGNLPYAAALVREHLRLAESRPEELRLVLQPLVEVFEREIAAAQACGAIRDGDARRDAGILFQLVSAHLHAVIFHQIDGPPARVAEELWAFCEAALQPRSSSS